MRIRSHLLLLAAGAMLPVLAFAVLVSVILVPLSIVMLLLLSRQNDPGRRVVAQRVAA